MSTAYITDAGPGVTLTRTDFDADGKTVSTETVDMHRYGVWKPDYRNRHRVVATGDDLDALQAEYGPLPVYPLPGTE